MWWKWKTVKSNFYMCLFNKERVDEWEKTSNDNKQQSSYTLRGCANRYLASCFLVFTAPVLWTFRMWNQTLCLGFVISNLKDERKQKMNFNGDADGFSRKEKGKETRWNQNDENVLRRIASWLNDSWVFCCYFIISNHKFLSFLKWLNHKRQSRERDWACEW